MLDLVLNPEDRFSHDTAHFAVEGESILIFCQFLINLYVISTFSEEIRCIFDGC